MLKINLNKIVYKILNKTRLFIIMVYLLNFYFRNIDFLKINYIIYYNYYKNKSNYKKNSIYNYKILYIILKAFKIFIIIVY